MNLSGVQNGMEISFELNFIKKNFFFHFTDAEFFFLVPKSALRLLAQDIELRQG
jgi:hypothetical protein